MPPYEKMYFQLFNAVTDALRELEDQAFSHAKNILIAAQQRGERLYIEAEAKKDEP